MNHIDRPGPTVAADDGLVEAFAHERFVDMFLSQNRRAQVSLLVAAALIAFIWFARTQSVGAIAWIGVAWVVAALRYLYTPRWIRQRSGQQATQRVAVLLLVNGILFAAPLVAFDRLSELERAAVSIILLASATASVATTSGYRQVFLAYAAPMLIPLAAAWVLPMRDEQSSGAAIGLGVLILLFLVFLVGIGRQSNRMFEETCRFRYGEQQLNRDLKLALHEASEANRAKTQFLAAASHDLRQPIHGMNVLVAALTLRDLDSRSREIVNLLDSVNQTLSKQLDGLLDISKLDAGTIKPELAIQRVDQMVAAHHAAMMPLANERGLAFVCECHDELSALTDAALLGRALSNLTDNAFKFTRRGGTVSLSAAREAGEVVIRVSDTGIGIPTEEQQQVFREFYQVGNVERDRSKGLGLGLSIVSRLCELLGVKLTLVSQLGVGTVVTMRMPEVASRAGTVRNARRAGMQPGLSVLVVDDEPMVRESMSILLTELGCIVHVADGSAQATRIATENRIDAVLSDYRLREGDSGLLAIQAVHRLHPTARAALITGDTAPDRIRDAQSAGAPLLHKPVTLRDLLAVLQADAE